MAPVTGLNDGGVTVRDRDMAGAGLVLEEGRIIPEKSDPR